MLDPLLDQLRDAGWMVAVHNDYRLKGERKTFTFWLLTHPNGRYIKGEGATDEEALSQCVAQAAVPAIDPKPLIEALRAFLRAQQVDKHGRYSGWRISGPGSINEAGALACAALGLKLPQHSLSVDPQLLKAILADSDAVEPPREKTDPNVIGD